MRRYLMVLAALAVVLLPACGGDEKRLTKAEFIEQGNAVCKEGEAEIDAAVEEEFGDEQPGDEEAEAFVKNTLIPSVERQIDDVRALKEPSEDEAEVNGMLDDADEILDAAKEDASTFFDSESDPFEAVNERLTAYGFTECGSD